MPSPLFPRLSALAALPLLLASLAASAQDARFLTYENDEFFNTDRYYTNGIQLAVRHAQDTRSPGERRLLDGLCRWLGCAGGRLLFAQNSFGQLMYTPSDITVAARQDQDRPYAGLLYLERDYVFLSPDGQTLTTLDSQAGFTGRLSLAEQTQKLVHRIGDRPEPRGWDHQVGNALAFLLSVERRSARPLLSGELGGGVRLQTNTYWRLTAGTLMSHAAGGVSLAIGKDLPAVSPMPPGITHRLGGGRLGTSCLWDWVQCTAFAGVEGRYVAYNLFLQGRPGREDPGVRPRRWVGDAMLGLRLDFPRTRGPDHGPWFVQFRATRRSAEFHAPARVPRHTFGALTLGTEF
ncbi:lipid A deacylase LpxR family protein [Massilia sp. ST3]|uniref:lipid A deacylase LpxR family protein n=1 Tax=Massilia sp. ST3 TaxID=2824903 RepID=UPI001B830DAA|nr:lipid A deacylase LpxR family protein [Massilia sp. ST3]MBQ5948794.1 lipid A deacylase LpxR family protein [Massilia sp. ST3]